MCLLTDFLTVVLCSMLNPIQKKGIQQLSGVNVCAVCVAPVPAPLWCGIVWLPAV